MRVHLSLEYLSYDDIRARADEFRGTYPNRIGPPLQIEEIVDLDMGIDIVPVWGLMEQLDIDGFTASDLTRIYVDRSVYEHRIEHRYRFTLAHEVGHVVLHGKTFEKHRFSDLAEYKEFIGSIEEDDRDWLEWQAYSFAGLVLVPSQELEPAFSEQLADPRLERQIRAAQASGLARKDYIAHVSERVSERIARRFAVSTYVVEKRLEYDNLHDRIP